MGERQARSVALEKAYVHEVYQQMTKAEHPRHENSNPWPRIKQLMEDLEPGSLVCDVGCGNGKYLSMNSSVFKIGGERCSRLADVARKKENEIIICDNLALPFRDESFDAVLSIAVVHHLATTERRVCALKELTRVLRIGGKLIITVWAMEQRHRKFESQDVLVPWHRPQVLSTPSFDSWQTTTSEDDCPPPYHAYIQASDSDSSTWLQRVHCRTKREKGRQKGRSEVMRRSSPSSSSLSSPNETCYSFVRRALQKLAGSKRGGSRSRGWFLEPWSSSQSEEIPMKRYDPEGCEDTEDIQDLPIELRRLEEDTESAFEKRQNFAVTRQQSDQLNYKSKSLGDIQKGEQQKQQMTRSRSSVPSLNSDKRVEDSVLRPEVETKAEMVTEDKAQSSNIGGSKPKLVKQKKSICDEDFEEEDRDKPTDMKDLVKAMPEFKVASSHAKNRETLFNKQISMNEELMSTDRMKEKEKVRQNIQKQASLNEDLIFRRRAPRTIDSLRNSFFSTSTSTAKRFQLLKSGLTNKLKNSTTNIEKAVAGSTFKNGFVRMLQGWKTDAGVPTAIPQPAPPTHPLTPSMDAAKTLGDDKICLMNSVERRHSKEDGSDSSKDSSLQSDTSVDSEDSFASVIYIPKPEEVLHSGVSVMEQSVTSPTLLASNPVSVPASPQATSPKLKFPPTAQPISPKLGISKSPKSPKSPQSSFGLYSHPSSPKIKQIPALQSTSTPSSPMLKHFPQPLSPRPFYGIFPTTKQSPLLKTPTSSTPGDSPVQKLFQQIHPMSAHTAASTSRMSPKSPISPLSFAMSSALPTIESEELALEPMRLSPTPASKKNPPSPIKVAQDESQLIPPKENPSETNAQEILLPIPPGPQLKSFEGTERKLEDKVGSKFVTSRPVTVKDLAARTAFPLVRRSIDDQNDGDLPMVTRQPNLLSLELFNPETDDMDSDSSGLSSSGSVGSVISVLNEELTADLSTQDMSRRSCNDINEAGAVKHHRSISGLQITKSSSMLNLEIDSEEINSPNDLLEAAAGVANSLEETVDTVLKSSPRSRRAMQASLTESVNLALGTSVSRLDDTNERSSQIEKHWSEYQKVRQQKGLLNEQRESEVPKINMKTRMEGNVLSNRRTDSPPTVENWGPGRQECVEFAEKLSEKLLAEIDKKQASEMTAEDSIQISRDDPYIQRLNKELENLNELSQEIQNTQKELRENLAVKKKIEDLTEMVEYPVSEDNTQTPTRELQEPEQSTGTQDLDSVREGDTAKNIVGIGENTEENTVTLEESPEAETGQEHEANTTKSADESSGESSEAEAGSWADSRRNTITSRTDGKLKNIDTKDNIKAFADSVVTDTADKPRTVAKLPEMKRIELLSGSEIPPRRPSISIETTEPYGRIVTGKSEEMIPELTALQSALSVESSEAGDVSDRTIGSSSDGSRSESRRGTIAPTETSSILSLRPGLSLESSDNGEIGSVSDVSRAGDSRKDTMSFDEPPTESQISLLRPGASIESSDYGDISDRTASGSETKGSSFGGVKTDSTASLASDRWSDCSKDIKFADRKIARCDGRSSSEETVPRRASLIRQRASIPHCPETTDKAEAGSTETSLSDSTSQDSMMSDCAGGSITFHRYYHVFKEGELDQLIESYIDNLHIISSYYDHANWCIIAEKVQVWTI